MIMYITCRRSLRRRKWAWIWRDAWPCRLLSFRKPLPESLGGKLTREIMSILSNVQHGYRKPTRRKAKRLEHGQDISITAGKTRRCKDGRNEILSCKLRRQVEAAYIYQQHCGSENVMTPPWYADRPAACRGLQLVTKTANNDGRGQPHLYRQ